MTDAARITFEAVFLSGGREVSAPTQVDALVWLADDTLEITPVEPITYQALEAGQMADTIRFRDVDTTLPAVTFNNLHLCPGDSFSVSLG